MSSATTLPALDNTMGALYLGVIFAMALWGAGSVQTYYYFNGYPNDDWRLKLLVGAVWCLDTLHQGFITHTCYIYLITNYANPDHLFVVVKSILYMVMASGLVCLFVQCFLIFRVWMLSQKHIPTVVVLFLLVIGEFISVLIYYVRASKLYSFKEQYKIVNVSRSINILSVASDVAIAFTLIFLLRRSRTGFKRSETIINRLILFTINTGLLTSLCAIMSLVAITVWPNNFIYITFFICISKLYSNALFATLNARKSVVGDLHDGTDINYTGSIMINRFRPRTTEIESQAAGRTFQSLNDRMLQIKVNTETTDFSDLKYSTQSKAPQPLDVDGDVDPRDQKAGSFNEV